MNTQNFSEEQFTDMPLDDIKAFYASLDKPQQIEYHERLLILLGDALQKTRNRLAVLGAVATGTVQ